MLSSIRVRIRVCVTMLVGAVVLAAPVRGHATDRLDMPPLTTGAVVASGARPLAAWADFCRRHAEDCRIDRSEPTTVAMTPAIWKLINSVNASVNRAIVPVTDAEHWGVVDKWDYPDDGKGDCEDYQLLKRKRLVAAGLPRRALLMTVVLDEANEGHAVLTVRTDRGDFVLDNKRDEVLSWSDTGYAFVKRESQVETAWVAIDAGAAVLATAARR